MKYYLKSKRFANGDFELYYKLSKKDRKTYKNYFMKVKELDKHFFYLNQTSNGVSIYKLSENGRLLQKRVFQKEAFLTPPKVLVRV